MYVRNIMQPNHYDYRLGTGRHTHMQPNHYVFFFFLKNFCSSVIFSLNLVPIMKNVP